MSNRTRHFILPDTQCAKGHPVAHLRWIGAAIKEYQPDVLMHLGDHWDMPAASSWSAAGSKSKEGNRLHDDIEAGNQALALLEDSMEGFKPKRKVILRGNHEDRLTRVIEADPKLDGVLGHHLFNDAELGWETVPYFRGSPKAIVIDGITYAHYFANPNTGKPIAGTVQNRLAKIGGSFVQGHQQGLLQGNVQFATGRRAHGLVAGSCLTPDHKVLTADLKYVPLGDVKAGDKLVSFEESPINSRKRGYKTGTVEAVKIDRAECFEVTLASGKVFKVTGDHYWLTRVAGQKSQENGSSYMWRQTSQLRVGSVIPKMIDEWSEATSHEAGYLKGMYDGEGCLYARTVNSSGGAVAQLSLSQKEGPVLEECKRLLSEIVGLDNITFTKSNDVCDLRIKGGAKKVAKMLGTIRPIRLLSKFKPELLGSLHTNVNDKIVSIKSIGEQDIVRIAIDEKTMIVEGYPHHNCYLHDESYKGMANAHWRGVVVLNEVNNGEFCEMPLSLDYLCRKYEGMSLARFMQRNYKNARQRFTVANEG
ncbi:metallophosphoesterase [Xanthomonas phage DES1]|nr:metallophosphoesterase [Xanthomonas phage DES1]